MTPKELIPVRMTNIGCLPPFCEANDKRKGPFDLYKGALGELTSKMFRKAQFNATLVPASKTGDCYFNGTCSGLYENLRTGQADMGMFPLPVDFSPQVNISNKYPLTVGPATDVQEIAFASLPHKLSSKVNFDILSSFEYIPWYFGAIQVVIFFYFFFLLNTSLSKSRATRLILKKRISLMEMFAIYMKQLFRFFRQPHRFVILVTMLIHITLLTVIIGGNISADMVAEFPPKYFSSLKEVISKYLPGREPMMLKGTEVQSKLIHTDSKFQPLGKIARTVASLDLLVKGFGNKSVLVEKTANIDTFRAYICIFYSEDKSYDLLRQSPLLHTSQRYFLFRPNISNEVVQRWTRVNYALTEFNIYERFQRKDRNFIYFAPTEVEKVLYYRCFLRNSAKKSTSSGARDLSNFHFNRPLAALVLMYFLATIVYLVEVIFGWLRRLRRAAEN